MTPFEPLDVEKLMQALVRKNPAPLSRERLRFALALEIREAIRDSRLLMGLSLGGRDNSTQIDILGLIGDQKLAVKLCYPASDADDCSNELEDLTRVCAADPDLFGLALLVTEGHGWLGNGNHRQLAWRNCPRADSPSWAGFEYTFAWMSGPVVVSLRRL